MFLGPPQIHTQEHVSPILSPSATQSQLVLQERRWRRPFLQPTCVGIPSPLVFDQNFAGRRPLLLTNLHPGHRRQFQPTLWVLVEIIRQAGNVLTSDLP